VLSAPSGDFDTYWAFQVEQERQQTTCLAYADSTVADSLPARRPQLPLVKRCKVLPSLGSERPAHTKGYNLIAGFAPCQEGRRSEPEQRRLDPGRRVTGRKGLERRGRAVHARSRRGIGARVLPALEVVADPRMRTSKARARVRMGFTCELVQLDPQWVRRQRSGRISAGRALGRSSGSATASPEVTDRRARCRTDGPGCS
jgi:hypothetical protein